MPERRGFEELGKKGKGIKQKKKLQRDNSIVINKGEGVGKVEDSKGGINGDLDLETCLAVVNTQYNTEIIIIESYN